MSYLLERYARLNNSFKKTLVFHVGESAGFFSEYNCMILAMLYCIHNKIRFVLYSKDANFGYQEGWNDYFEPFCEVTTCKLHKYLNMRPNNGKISFTNWRLTKWRIKCKLLNIVAELSRPFVPFTYYTQDLWISFFSQEMVTRKYYIPELNINGDLVHACNKLIELTWRFNIETHMEITKIVNSLNLPIDYASCHIRGGDKYIETTLLTIDPYVERIKENANIKNVFVLTDDYRIIVQLRNEYPQWNWYTLCGELEMGYFHSNFTKKNFQTKRNSLLNLFASIEIMSDSNRFIGTITSNPSIFMAICKPEITEGVDSNENLINLYFKS